MRRTLLLWIAVASLLVAARRPRYGGELRVEARSADFLDGLVFETLVRLDQRGEPVPWLATSWSHDAAGKRWLFTPRPGVTLHDGAVWSPGVIAIADDRPIESILRDLARPKNAIKVATGPFRAETPTRLVAHEGYWGGRPFLDSVQIQIGAGKVVDLEVGRADVVEIPVTEVRRAQHVFVTKPTETVALVFENTRAAEAVALAIDRVAIHNVLLQKQGEITGALLPQWLSGYAFLFAPERSVARARQLGGGQTVTFAYDRQDSVLRSIAERIAVNANEAGITMRPVTGAADVRLTTLHVGSTDAMTAIEDLGGAGATPYEAERALIDTHRIVPLFHLPRAWAMNGRVRNWPKLADVWIAP